MKLYHMPLTRSSRVLWTAYEVGAEIELAPVNLQKGEGQSEAHKARHPHGKLPAAEIEGENIIESGALSLHLAVKHAAGTPFLPDLGSAAGAKLLQWLFYATATLDDLTVNAYLQHRFAPEGAKDQAMIDKAAAAWKETITPFLTRELGEGPFLMGETFTLADVAVGYIVFYAAQLGWVNESLTSYVERVSERPAFKKAFGMA